MKCEYVFTKSKWGETDRRTFQEEYVLLIFQNLKVCVVDAWRATWKHIMK